MRKVVVLGGGFAGLMALKTLKSELSALRRVKISLVSNRAHFIATPFLSKVASGRTSLKNATAPLTRFTGRKAEITIDQIDHVDYERRVLIGDREHTFDYLILAPGSAIDWRGVQTDGHAIPCRDAQECVALYERVKWAFEEAAKTESLDARRELLTFVVCGAGPCGVELAANLMRDIARNLFSSYHPRLAASTHIILCESEDRVLPNFTGELSAHARSILNGLGIEVRLGVGVRTFDGETMVFTDERSLKTKHLFWCGGTESSPLATAIDDRETPHLRGTLESTTHSGVFVAGDSAADRASRKNAYHAVDQGVVAARNVVAQLSGRSTRRFEDRIWPTILELGDEFLAITDGNDVLHGRPARLYVASQRAKLLGPWMGRLAMLKDMARVMASRAPSSLESTLIGFDWE